MNRPKQSSVLLFMGQSNTSICQTWFYKCIKTMNIRNNNKKYGIHFENMEWIIDDLIQYAPYTRQTTFNVIHAHLYTHSLSLSLNFNDWMLHLRCGIEDGKFSVSICEKWWSKRNDLNQFHLDESWESCFFQATLQL